MANKNNKNILFPQTFEPSDSKVSFFSACKQGCQIFLGTKYQKTGKNYQITTKFNKYPQNLLNGRKIYLKAIKYTNIFLSKALQNVPEIGIFGMPMYIWQP
jgi:hypothetical protein